MVTYFARGYVACPHALDLPFLPYFSPYLTWQNVSTLAFKQMENISLFLRACRQLGVAEHSLFETVDLYEMKDLNVVVTCLYALGQTVQTTVPDFQGPHLGARSPSCVSSRRGSGGLVMRERLLPR